MKIEKKEIDKIQKESVSKADKRLSTLQASFIYRERRAKNLASIAWTFWILSMFFSSAYHCYEDYSSITSTLKEIEHFNNEKVKLARDIEMNKLLFQHFGVLPQDRYSRIRSSLFGFGINCFLVGSFGAFGLYFSLFGIEKKEKAHNEIASPD